MSSGYVVAITPEIRAAAAAAAQPNAERLALVAALLGPHLQPTNSRREIAARPVDVAEAA